MRYVKILGLAAIAAGALMAFVGAGTASADVLCTTNTTNECASGWRVTHIVASQVGTGVLKTTGGTTLDTCSGASVESEDTEGSETHEPGGAITSLTWSGCSATTTTINNGKLTIRTKETAGGVHDNTVVADNTRVTIQLFGITCVYGSGEEKSLGDLTVGQDPILHINVAIPKIEGGGLCPASGQWEATFTVTNHNAIWLSKK